LGDILLPQINSDALWGPPVRGKIRSRQVCPACGVKGKYEAKDFGRGRQALLCQCGGHISDRPEIRLFWGGQEYIITHDERGRRLRTLREAELVQGQISAQIQDGRFYPADWMSAKDNGLLWENYLQKYLDSEAQRLLPRGKATLDKKKSCARHLAWFNGRNIKELRTADIQDFAAQPALKSALAPKSRQDLLDELRFILRRAKEREEIQRVPAFPKVAVPKKTIRYATRDQQLKVIEKMSEEHRPVFWFLFIYGVRVAEACALCWDMVDRAKGEVTIGRTFSRRQLQETTKGNSEAPFSIVGPFAEYLEQAVPGVGKAPVFRNSLADRRRNPEGFYTPDYLNGLWKEGVKAAKLEPVKLMNGTRHSFMMQALIDGWSLEEMRGGGRHASYAHIRRYAEANTQVLRPRLEARVRSFKPKK